MQAPGDNSITVVGSHVETYADNNINEKDLTTQYIYTTEGKLIPATEDNSASNMELNSQHFNTVHVTEAQEIHIQQVEYQYEQQYSDGTVQVITDTGTEFVQDQSSTYVIEPQSFAPENSQPPTAIQERTVEGEVVTEGQPHTYNVAEPTAVEETYITQEATVADGHVPTEHVVDTNEKCLEIASDNSQSVDGQIESIPEGKPILPKLGVNASQTIDNPKEVSSDVGTEEPKDSEHSIITPEEDETNIENLKSNPAIEIEEETSTENIEESMEEEQTVVEAKAEVTQESVDQEIEESEAANQEELINEESSSQDAVLSEDDRIFVEEPASPARVNHRGSNEINLTPRPRGRRPKTEIPLHILGHDVSKPMESFVNGRTPKPRLGVKVPNRNLTSQIVSKAEIEKEIIERGRKKQIEQKEISFARQLTSRLAQKIAPESGDSSTAKSSKDPKKKDAEIVQDNQTNVDDNGNEEDSKGKSKAIDNNSDLLAILEGDGDAEEEISELPKESQDKEATPTDETNLKNLEREIALQQLQDLPYLSPKTKFVKGNKLKMYPKESTKSEGHVTSLSGKIGSVMKPPTLRSPIKANALKLEAEPQIKMNMTLKTYSRKRKSNDGLVESVPSPSKKINVVVDPQEIDVKPNISSPLPDPVYVTKSSRVIKKKVIWDPDETPTKPKPSPGKAEVLPPPKVVQKSAAPKNETKPADLPKKSADLPKKSADLPKKSADLQKKPATDAKTKTEKKVEEKPSPKRTVNSEKKTSPGTSKLSNKPKRPMTEVDRLLGDEGAIKMLYDLKNSENAIDERRNKTVISVEKTFKELAKKANQIKSDLVNTSSSETPKFLRKKESAVSPGAAIATKPSGPVAISTPSAPGVISRQKSKDSARSTPPASPAYSYPHEVSYLIRRRSSSSISSDGNTGGSLDFDDTEDSSESDCIERLSKKRPISTSEDPLKIKKYRSKSESEKVQRRLENKLGHYKTFSFKKSNKSVTIDLHTGGSTQGYLTLELLDELTTLLSKLSKEKECNVILIKSTKEDVFSNGLRYKDLLSDKESIRKNKANELANQIKDFIKCLLNFPKILVAGVRGACVGLAVTMLPLFDIVIASDDALFSAPYNTLGCVAEAGFLLTVPHISSSGLAGELFYTAQKLTADEACRRGLISKLCWPEKYQDTIKSTVAAVAVGSKQSLESTKKQLRSPIKQSTEEALDSMVTELVEHWISHECQNHFAQIK